MSTPEQELLTKYLLSRLLGKGDLAPSDSHSFERRDDQDPASSIVYPQVTQKRIRRPLQKLLDQVKENIDVIDFRNPDKQVNFSKKILHEVFLQMLLPATVIRNSIVRFFPANLTSIRCN